jgi:hypothetical protein
MFGCFFLPQTGSLRKVIVKTAKNSKDDPTKTFFNENRPIYIWFIWIHFKQETIQKLNEKPTFPTQGQNYSKVTLHTKTFPTIPIMWWLVGGNPVFRGDRGEAIKWKILIYRLIPAQRHKRAFNYQKSDKNFKFIRTQA